MTIHSTSYTVTLIGLTKNELTPINSLVPSHQTVITKSKALEKYPYSFVIWTDEGLFLSNADDLTENITTLFQSAFEASLIEEQRIRILDIVKLNKNKVYTLVDFAKSNNVDAVYGALHQLVNLNHLQRVDAYNGIARWVTA